MDFVKVVLLGGSGVGKTSIVQRFVHNEFNEKYTPTEQKETYYPSVIINDHLYELKISDLPVISYFPVNSYYEWADYRFYGLRSATAYILVFDLSNVETFQFVRTMREQMIESRDMKHVPLLIVGNKQDLIVADAGSGNSGVSMIPSNVNQRKRRDIVNLVKKHWKCNYVECSAKHNWGVIAVFKELMEVIDFYSSPVIDNIQDAFDGNKCAIL
ncbi:conserved hypothetical protein [Pediculus humanus corporis]|uniref:Uncharacterized protein n=1 Tax=Pediculus humanus subsp. corporis TaxID=121224 RepID=E0W1U5_PEDHC|nr:uncharacterized protein Phum_PHUM582720 [Pediculus humanus corporis]EEB19677.1 conserved hypothetical protein [Pediculus humanus corporis]